MSVQGRWFFLKFAKEVNLSGWITTVHPQKWMSTDTLSKQDVQTGGFRLLRNHPVFLDTSFALHAFAIQTSDICIHFFPVHDLIPFWTEIFPSTSFSFQPFPPFQTHSYILVAGTGIPMYRISPSMPLWQITWSSWLQVLLVAVYVVSWCRNKKHFLWFCCLEIFSVHLLHGKWIRCVCIN